MKSSSLCRSSLLALSLAAALAPSGCIAQSSDSDGAGGGEPEKVGAATQALQVSDLAETLVVLSNGWHCAQGDSSCGMTLSWFGSSPPIGTLDTAGDVENLVEWLLVPVPGTTDQFYMYSGWGCGWDTRCGMDLGFTGTTVDLYPQDDENDLVPWRFVPVAGTTDQFYVYNEWHCAQGDSRCGMSLSWFGSSPPTAALVNASDTYDLVPWTLTVHYSLHQGWL